MEYFYTNVQPSVYVTEPLIFYIMRPVCFCYDKLTKLTTS